MRRTRSHDQDSLIRFPLWRITPTRSTESSSLDSVTNKATPRINVRVDLMTQCRKNVCRLLCESRDAEARCSSDTARGNVGAARGLWLSVSSSFSGTARSNRCTETVTRYFSSREEFAPFIHRDLVDETSDRAGE